MHYLYPLVATSRTGETRLLYTREAYYAFLSNKVIGERFTRSIRKFNHWTRVYEWLDVEVDWILRDDRGRVVDPDPLDRRPDWFRFRRAAEFEHRNGPVPGLHGHYRRCSQAARKRHGGRGVAARIAAFHSGRAVDELE